MHRANRSFVYQPATVSLSDFVSYWSPMYGEKNRELDASLYFPNINGPHTVETLEQLFSWKIGPQYYNKHLPLVTKNFINRMEVARTLSPTATPAFFLNKVFPVGGAIYRIFWLHCWYPDRFPIYDQHVHRAMVFIEEGRIEELDTYNDVGKINLYPYPVSTGLGRTG